MEIGSSEGGSAKSWERKRKRTKMETIRPSRWRTEGVLQLYSKKLLEALRHIRRIDNPSSPSPPRNLAVKAAADRVLATAARGRMRWNRAIVANRKTLALKLRKPRAERFARPRKMLGAPGTGASLLGKKLSVLQSKVRMLGRLVPGCRKLSFPTLLEEASDYIAALEMQVRAMSALTEILSSGS